MVCSILTSLKNKYRLTPVIYQRIIQANRKAIVVGATSGIGEACSKRLARQGFTVIAIGRYQDGRQKAVVEALNEASKEGLDSFDNNDDDNNDNNKLEQELPKHEFRSCDAFSLKDIKRVCNEITNDHPSIDALVMTQGMATIQGFTPTNEEEQNDEKLTLHYWSRMAFINELLSSLKQSTLSKGPIVLSVLSGGVHSPYKDFRKDPELKLNYSIKNAADIAGYYNDLGLDYFALKHPNVNFVHASPGFVNTNWGNEMPYMLKKVIRLLQPLGRTPIDCAEYLLGSTVFVSEFGDSSLPVTKGLNNNTSSGRVIIIGENGQSKSLTNQHTTDDVTFCYNITKDVLKRSANIELS